MGASQVSRAIFVVNPVARGIPLAGKLDMAVAWLESRGWEASIERTAGPGDATVLAHQAAEDGCDVVVACGGDGTVNETINGLAGTKTALAVVVGGTANVWAKEMGISREPLAAVRLVSDGVRRRIDLGVVEGDDGQKRFFLLMAGVGLDGYVVKRVPLGLKRRLGAASYVLYGLRESLRFDPERTSITIDGETISGDLMWLLASNTRSYGGVIDITRKALVDDGLLDVLVFEGRGLRKTVGHGLRIVAHRFEGKDVTSRRVASIEIGASSSLDCQVDGEILPFSPRTIRVEPLSLAVMLPAEAKSPLFSK